MALLLPQQVVRRSGRIPKEIPIVLIGSDWDGRVFSEQTKTVLLSPHGAGLLSRHKLTPEQELVLRWPERNKETDIRIVGQIGEDSGVYTYGAVFSDQVQSFWEMDFPPPSKRDVEFGHLTLVCNICQSVDRVDDASEADVVATNDGVLRFCKCCGTSTVWRPGQAGALPTTPVQAGAPSAALLPAREPHRWRRPSVYRRRPHRFRSFDAASPARDSGTCQPGGDSASAYSAAAPSDLIAGGIPTSGAQTSVTSLFRPAQPYKPTNGSAQSPATSVLTLPAAQETPSPAQKPAPRTGFSGINRRKYPRIRVIYMGLVRHTERGEEFVQCEDISRGGQAAIFGPARIVYVQELPEQNLFRYCVQYLSSDKPRGAF